MRSKNILVALACGRNAGTEFQALGIFNYWRFAGSSTNRRTAFRTGRVSPKTRYVALLFILISGLSDAGEEYAHVPLPNYSEFGHVIRILMIFVMLRLRVGGLEGE